MKKFSTVLASLAFALTIGTATVGAQPNLPVGWPKGVDEQVTVTCHTASDRCVAIRVDVLGNTEEDRYDTLPAFMGWYTRVSAEFVEQVTVYLTDDWAPGY